MRILFLCLLIVLATGCSEPTTRFERMTSADTGIDFTNTITASDSFHILDNEYMYNGGGVGVGDLNQDGLPDLVFTGNQVNTQVYLNKGDFSFEDISDQFPGLEKSIWHSGVAMVDINADGLLDIYLTSTTNDDPEKRRNQLWVNKGKDSRDLPYFEEVAASYGIADTGYSVHAGFFDYDLDGDLDLYVLNNIVNNQVPTSYRPKLSDGSAQNNDQLYENTGNGTFKNVTLKAGILYEGYGLGLAIGDVNKDGYPDLFISNDYVANDLIYVNQRDGTFKNEAEELLAYSSQFSMGNDMADINQDGYPDMMTLDMLPEKIGRKKQNINGSTYLTYINDERYNYQHQYMRNMVQLHSGFQQGKMLPYTEVGRMLGMFQTEWSWSPLFADYDNDGDRDLLLTNGFPKDLTDKDFTNYKAQMHGYLASDQQVIDQIPVAKVANFAYEQTGPLTFSDQTEEWGMDIPSFSNGASFVDLDRDGDLDYVVNNIDDPAFIFQNHSLSPKTPTHFLELELRGEGQNTLAIGAKIELWAGGSYQFYEHFLSRGYISSVDPIIHFGLGKNTTVDSLRIIWPSGKKQTLQTQVPVDQLLQVEEKEAKSGKYQGIPKAQPSLFTRKTDGPTYVHRQEDYVDFFQGQRILPHKFSQIGPCMTQGDLNGDGELDLLIGGNAQTPFQVWLKKGTGFQPTEVPGLSGLRTCSDADLALCDLDGDGDQDLIALAGGYEEPLNMDYKHYWYQNDGRSFSRQELPVPGFIGSVVRPFDFDHDGDMDLFLGARVKRETFPFAPASYLLVNEGPEFRPIELELGMVTDAVWSDYDGDGWEDLLVAREWNSLALLQNETGNGLNPVSKPAWESASGLWSAIAAADLDGDGDEDYVVGNLGENHRFTVSETHPMRLYALDIDMNGQIDPIQSAYWEDSTGTLQEYPIHFLDELASQSPYFRRMYNSYKHFSKATIPSMLLKEKLKGDEVFTLTTTASQILWNEGGTFRWEALPMQAQVAPVREILVRDWNGDGKQDILIAGNDYSYDVLTGVYASQRGTLLLGGEGSFGAMGPAENGLLLDGQVESLLYFPGNEAFLVAAINRDSLLVYRHNVPLP